MQGVHKNVARRHQHHQYPGISSLGRPSRAVFRRAGHRSQHFLSRHFYLGTKIQHWSSQNEMIRTEMGKEVAVLRSEVDKARAEAVKETSDRFLMYGYAEEFRKKALGDKAPSSHHQ